MKLESIFLALLLLAASCSTRKGQNTTPPEVPDNCLAGTDELGRVLLQNGDVGDPKPDRRIALFYFLWQGDKGSPVSPHSWDLEKIAARSPEVFEDSDHPDWGGRKGSYYFWGEPVYGYYRGDDYWVHLRNVQLLTDAGVDLLVIDATNRLTYPEQSEALMKAMDAVRAQGKNPPQIAYYTNTLSGETMQEIYDSYYREGAPYRHPGCWFYLEGKPLIIGVTKEAEGKDYKPFFTFRESQWPTVPRVANGWPWISFTRKPQVHFNHRGKREIVNVSVAQHPNPGAGMGGSAFYGNRDNWGRSYRNGSHGNPETDRPYGYNMQEQWDSALKENTPFIFVTGWNEWVAGRWDSHDSNPEHSWFCDAASAEYSRDLEPSLTASLKDNYYMQMVNNIRRYKGTGKQPPAGDPKTVTGLQDWKTVSFVYTDYTGDTQPRNHPGAQSEPPAVYENRTGRNDFHLLKAAHDSENIYFYASTAGDITPVREDSWMRLYLDTDRNASTGWKGYDFRVLRGTVLQRFDGGAWTDVPGKAPVCQVEKNEMMITVPLEQIRHPSALEFKWSDNMQAEDPMDWYVNGDAAPGGRFNFIYIMK
ncbi:MAG: hypothetical protein LBL07_18945 [Tannerella sp.]|jgi:hypothetical protein|nr:hypothetical protein [Tannerella sp.]